MHQNKLIKHFAHQPKRDSDSNPLLNNMPTKGQFHQQLMVTRMEQMQKIKNVSDLGLSKDQIANFIINPVKIERSNKNEIEKYVREEEATLTKNFLENNWWKNRTNTPYKNILKQELNKNIKSANDLVVHKVTGIDKIGLIEEYDKLVKLLDKHNSELKDVYSVSAESTHRKEFEYVNKYKYKMKYDPKNFDELKDYYKNEQNKLDAEHKRIDDIITRLIDDDVGEEEIKQLEKEITKPAVSKSTDIDKQILELLQEHGNDLLNELDDKLDKIQVSQPIAEPSCQTSQPSQPSRVKIIKNEPNKQDIKVESRIRIVKKN